MKKGKLWAASIVLASTLFASTTIDASAATISATGKKKLTALTKKSGSEGIAVRDAKTGKLLFSYNANKLFTPASNMKILTSTAVLDTLGEDYQFTTTVKTTGKLSKKGTLDGSLYLVGEGDPSLQKKHLKKMAKKLKKQGINKINGSIFGDDTWFDRNYYAPGILKIDKPYYYGAKVSALTLAPNDNYGTGTVYSGSRRVPIGNPTSYTLAAFVSALKAEGIKLSKSTYKIKKAPKTAKVAVENKSPELSKIIYPFMKYSDNAIADVLVKTMSRSVYAKTGSNANGVLAMKSYAKNNKVDLKKWKFIDGSGMSHSNKVTASQLSKYLYEETKKDYYKTFYKSLPVGGKTGLTGGTLSGRLKSVSGRVHAKTGTLDKGVHTLSGYVTKSDGEQVVVSVLTKGSSRSAIDDIYRTIVKY